MSKKTCFMTLGWLMGRQIAAQRNVTDAQWETIWEGEATTALNEEDNISATATLMETGISEPLFYGSETIRITVDGVRSVVTAESSDIPSVKRSYAGNRYLFGSDVDTGLDVCVCSVGSMATAFSHLTVATRIAGTYQIKIERQTA